ncbi:primase C-terminal domain-containing protein [Priestia megaterium]
MITSSIRDLFHTQLTEQPKVKAEKELTGYNSRLGWVYLSNNFRESKAVRTFGTLFVMGKEYEFFTPNTFYRKDKRLKTTLRWLNSMSVDVDVKNGQNEKIYLPDILDRITDAGLPAPSIVVQTPSKGFHVHWFFAESKRASRKMNKHYTRIQTRISEILGADLGALGPERFYRLPKETNTIFTSDARPDFNFFYDWYDIQIQEENEERKAYKQGFCTSKNLLKHPAIQKLMEGVSKGKRDRTCFTLALAYKASGYSQAETEGILQDWNLKNAPAMSWVQVNRKVCSAYRGNYHGPAASHIRELSDMEFSYVKWESAKQRKERTYSHLEEWEKDVLTYIKRRKGTVSGSQRALASAIKSSADKTKSIAFSTLKKVLASLEEQGKIKKEVQGSGRGSVTILTVVEQKKEKTVSPKLTKEEVKKKLMGPIANTLEDWAVGGSALPSLPPTPISSPTISIPKNVPAAFSSLSVNLGFDGRFVFGAWGRIQLAFKSFGIPFSAISSNSDYLNLALSGLRATVARKGSLVRGDFQGPSAFFKYLYGTVTGMLQTYREDSLRNFVSYIEDLSDLRLSFLGAEIAHMLAAGDFADQDFLRDQLREIDSEQSARQRRKVYQTTFWEDSSFHDFRFVLKHEE